MGGSYSRCDEKGKVSEERFQEIIKAIGKVECIRKMEYKPEHWPRKDGTHQWAAFPKRGLGIGGHWIKEPDKPLVAHIDIRKNGRKIGKY